MAPGQSHGQQAFARRHASRVRVGGKTGTGVNGTANDVVLVWPKQGAAPLVVAAYLTGAQAVDDAARDAILAQAGALVAQWWKHQQQA